MRGLWVGFAILFVVFVGVGIYAVNSIQATRESLGETGRAAGDAASEMRANAGGIGDATLDYVRTDDRAARERAGRGKTGFEEARARYEDLLGARATVGRGARIEALYGDYAALSESLMDGNDEQRAANDRVEEGFAGVRNILGEQSRAGVNARGPDGLQKGREAASMSGAVAGVERSLRGHLRNPSQETLDRGSRSAGDFREALARFERLDLTGQERDRADELRERFDATMNDLNDLLVRNASLREDAGRFSDLRADLEGALNEEEGAQRSGSLRGATDEVLGQTQTLVLVVLAAVLFALAVVLFAGGGAASHVGRLAGRLARATRSAAGKVRRGEFRLERRLLPAGILLAALLWVAQAALEAFAFGGGDFAGALFPARVREWLPRALLASAVISSFAYVQFVLGRREREKAPEDDEAQGPPEVDDEARFELAAIVQSSDDAIIARRVDGIITSWNSGAERLYGYSAKEVVGGYGFNFVPPERLNEMLGVLERLRHRESFETYETVHVNKNGRLIDVALTISPIRDSAGNPIGYSTIARDITERKRSEESLRQQKDLYEALLRAQSEVGEGLLILEAGRVVYTNEAFAEISGYGPEELMALPNLLDLLAPEERVLFGERLHPRPGGRDGEERRETVILHKSGPRVNVETGIKTIEEVDGRPRLIAIVRDITERKRAEERLAHLARYDHLTGLGNRVLFQESLEGALARAHRGARPVALMFLDLDRFKAVNDTLGHASGDLLLKTVAERLRGSVRETDTVSRMGGDEFGVILEGINAGQDAAVVARKIIHALSQPFDLDGHEVVVTCSIGIAVAPSSPGDVLVRDADAAMYRAKQQGRNNYQFYTPEMNAQAFQRLTLETNMRAALEREEFVLSYQPQVDLATGRICGAEALLRWRDPHSGLVPPDEFIHVLEDSGLIVPVGEWVLRTACAQARAWEDAGLVPIRISVNISGRQFNQDDLAGRLARILDETGLDPNYLELELTESLLMEDIAVSNAMLDELRVLMGLRLSVDDFGTGYSSLSYLKRFPLDTLKIDRSFVRDIATDRDDAAIVASIISLAHNLQLEVIAEGVETEEQLAYLREKGCDIVQGFYFSEPLPAQDLWSLLKKGEPQLGVPVRD